MDIGGTGGGGLATVYYLGICCANGQGGAEALQENPLRQVGPALREMKRFFWALALCPRPLDLHPEAYRQ